MCGYGVWKIFSMIDDAKVCHEYLLMEKGHGSTNIKNTCRLESYYCITVWLWSLKNIFTWPWITFTVKLYMTQLTWQIHADLRTRVWRMWYYCVVMESEKYFHLTMNNFYGRIGRDLTDMWYFRVCIWNCIMSC